MLRTKTLTPWIRCATVFFAQCVCMDLQLIEILRWNLLKILENWYDFNVFNWFFFNCVFFYGFFTTAKGYHIPTRSANLSYYFLHILKCSIILRFSLQVFYSPFPFRVVSLNRVRSFLRNYVVEVQRSLSPWRVYEASRSDCVSSDIVCIYLYFLVTLLTEMRNEIWYKNKLFHNLFLQNAVICL